MKQLLLASWIVFAGFCSGQTIETDLVYKVKEPTKKTTNPPVLILLHGYGSNEEDLFDLANTFDERFITFSLRAPRALQENGFCWYTLGDGPNRSLKYDYKEAKQSSEKVLNFIKKACRAYQLDSSSVFLLGFSQGAILSYDIALSSPGKIKGVMALSGRLMVESKTRCSNWALMNKTWFFIAHGNFDNVIQAKESENAATFLKSKGLKNVSYQSYDMQHSINGKELNDMKSWLSKALVKNTVPPNKK